MRIWRCQPLFPPDTWNCHEATRASQSRTNNICEGWNNAFANLVGYDHSPVWKLIDGLQKKNKRVHTLVLQDARGIQPKKRRRRIFDDLQKRLENLCNDFLGGHKDMSQFLSGVSHKIRFGQPYIYTCRTWTCF